MGTASRCAGVGRSPYTPGGRGHSCIPSMPQHSLLMSMRKVTLYTLHIRLYSIPSPALFLLGDFQSLLQFMPIILLKGPLILHSLYSLLERRPFFNQGKLVILYKYQQLGVSMIAGGRQLLFDCDHQHEGGGSCNHYQHCDHHHRHLCWPKQLLWNSY